MTTPRVIDSGMQGMTEVISGIQSGSQELVQKLAERGKELLDEAFLQGGLPEHKWPERTTFTLALTSQGKVLVRTKALESSSFVEQEDDYTWVFGLDDDKAVFHEFGCIVQITPKMRAYFHARDVHISASKKYFVIPERSMLRSAADRLEIEYPKIYAESLGLWTKFKFKVKGFLSWS